MIVAGSCPPSSKTSISRYLARALTATKTTTGCYVYKEPHVYVKNLSLHQIRKSEVMQNQSILYHKASFNFRKIADRQCDSRMRYIIPNLLPDRSLTKSGGLKAKILSITKVSRLDCLKFGNSFETAVKGVANENLEEFSDDDDELCPVDCVREVRTDDEFLKILEKAKETHALVVMDFYRTSCGSCKYIGQIFSKLCKGSGDQDAKVIFLKHNVIDEYEEQSEVAERLRIKAVPLFHFYKDGALLEAFPTRDKDRIVTAIHKYADPDSQDV